MGEKYSCGHSRPELLILNSNVLIMSKYINWKEDLRGLCYDCYDKSMKVVE